MFVESSSTIFFDDDAYAFTSTRHNFFLDDARPQGIRLRRRVDVFFHDVGH